MRLARRPEGTPTAAVRTAVTRTAASRTAGTPADDTGAVAVEMALVTPLLLLLLFGIIQYGALFHTMQAASATARDAATEAAKGILDCDAFRAGVRADAAGNGIPADPDPWQLVVHYDTSAGQPNTYGAVKVTLTYSPQHFLSFIPLPSPLVQTAVAPIQNPSELQVTECPVDPS